MNEVKNIIMKRNQIWDASVWNAENIYQVVKINTIKNIVSTISLEWSMHKINYAGQNSEAIKE